MKIVQVEWIDSKMYFEQVSEGGIEAPCIVTSVGYLVKDDPDWIAIARESIDGEWRGVIAIPMVAIKWIKEPGQIA
jgi:hypothetical protein